MNIKITALIFSILGPAAAMVVTDYRKQKTLAYRQPVFRSLTGRIILPLILLLIFAGQLQPATGKKEQNLSIPARIQEFLLKELGPDRLEKLEQELKPEVNSESFDLYLLYFWLKGQPLEGLCLLELNLSRNMPDPYLLSNTAAFLFGLAQYQLAYEALLKAQAIIPDNPCLLNNLGAVSYQLSRPEESRKFFESATRLDNYHPEANRALYLLDLATSLESRNPVPLNKSLKGAYRESLAKMIPDPPLPLSSWHEVYLSQPVLPEDFISYLSLVPFYQEAFLKMEAKEASLKQELDSLLASGLKFPAIEATVSSGLALNSTRVYFCLSELEGQLDFLVREIERPADIRLEQLITQAIGKLDAVFRDYQKKEKDCLELPRPERPECLKKIKEDYCQRYLDQAEHYYKIYRKWLLDYFSQFEPRIKKFINEFYFWVRYLPEDQQSRKRAEIELQLWHLYSRLWEKTFRLLTRLGQPAFSDCLPELPLTAETTPEPEIALYDPFSNINLNYQGRRLTFSIRADRIVLALSGAQTERPGQNLFTPSTVYLYPPETCGSQPLYLVLDEQGKLNDLAELGPWAFTGLNTGNTWKILINLSLPEPAKKQ